MAHSMAFVFLKGTSNVIYDCFYQLGAHLTQSETWSSCMAKRCFKSGINLSQSDAPVQHFRVHVTVSRLTEQPTSCWLEDVNLQASHAVYYRL